MNNNRRFILALAIGLLVLLGTGCEGSVGDFMNDLFGDSKNEQENAASIEEKVDTQKAPESEAPDAFQASGVKIDGKDDDWIIGWSDDSKFFAYQQVADLPDGTRNFTLFVINTSLGRLASGKLGSLTVSSKEPDVAGEPDPKAAAQKKFKQTVSSILMTYGYFDKPDQGQTLFDEGSFKKSFPQKRPPSKFKKDIVLPEYSDSRIIAKIKTEKIDPAKRKKGSSYKEQSSIRLELKTKDKAGKQVQRTFISGEFARAGALGYWIRSAHLSPDGKRVVVLFEEFVSRTRLTKKPGRQTLAVSSVHLEGLDKAAMKKLLQRRKELREKKLSEKFNKAYRINDPSGKGMKITKDKKDDK